MLTVNTEERSVFPGIHCQLSTDYLVDLADRGNYAVLGHYTSTNVSAYTSVASFMAVTQDVISVFPLAGAVVFDHSFGHGARAKIPIFCCGC